MMTVYHPKLITLARPFIRKDERGTVCLSNCDLNKDNNGSAGCFIKQTKELRELNVDNNLILIVSVKLVFCYCVF